MSYLLAGSFWEWKGGRNIKTTVLTHAGLVRQQNEDSYLLLPEHNFFAVADGMGGHQAGAFASSLALKIIKKEIMAPSIGEDLREQLARAVQAANSKIYDLASKDPSKKGMGTTLTAFWIGDYIAHFAHVGDSRAYLLRETELTILTRDHSWVEELRRRGSLTQKEAQTHPKKHVLTRALGVEDQVKVDTKSLTLGSGDLLFLCTDGLTNLVQDQEIKFAFSQPHGLQSSLEGLMELAFIRGGQDNITMIAVLMD